MFGCDPKGVKSIREYQEILSSIERSLDCTFLSSLRLLLSTASSSFEKFWIGAIALDVGIMSIPTNSITIKKNKAMRKKKNSILVSPAKLPKKNLPKIPVT